MDFFISEWDPIHNGRKSLFYTQKYRLSHRGVQDCINQKLAEFTKIVQPHRGKTRTNASRMGTFLEREGHIAGEIRIVKGWNALGRAVGPLF